MSNKSAFLSLKYRKFDTVSQFLTYMRQLLRVLAVLSVHRWRELPITVDDKKFSNPVNEDCLCFHVSSLGSRLMTFHLLCQLRRADRLDGKLYEYLPNDFCVAFSFSKQRKTQLTSYRHFCHCQNNIDYTDIVK